VFYYFAKPFLCTTSVPFFETINYVTNEVKGSYQKNLWRLCIRLWVCASFWKSLASSESSIINPRCAQYANEKAWRNEIEETREVFEVKLQEFVHRLFLKWNVAATTQHTSDVIKVSVRVTSSQVCATCERNEGKWSLVHRWNEITKDMCAFVLENWQVFYKRVCAFVFEK